MHRHVVRVRYGDTDPMGFAYYAHFLRWFEIGRAEMLRDLGLSYRSVEQAGIRLPVLEARVRYLEPARYDDAVAIETGVAELRRASVRFGYRIVREVDERLLAEGHTEHCFMNLDDRATRPPAALAAVLERAPRTSVPGA